MNPKDALLHLGLTTKEVAAYLALLETGEATVQIIARKAGLKRPTTYLVLSSLVMKGFASKIEKRRQMLFVALHPQKILTEARVRLKEMQEVVPQLESMLQHAGSRPRVSMYEGKEALDRAYDEAFLIKGEALAISNTAIIEDVFARTLSKMSYVTLSKEFRMREVLDDSPQSHEYAQRYHRPHREIRIMPKGFVYATDVGVFGNTTLITSGKKEYFTVKIESDEIANSFRSLFEAMWQISKPAITQEI